MSFSTSETRLAGPAPRIYAALALSVALHLALLSGLKAPSEGNPAASATGRQPVFSVVLRDEPATSASVSGPSVQPVARERTGLPGHRYYTTAELDSRPGIMSRIEPQYPERAARRHLSGKVVIRVFIDSFGIVERATALKADPPGYFEAAAERAFQGARFTPGRKDGHPVRVQMTLEISFDSPEPVLTPG